MAFHQFKKEQIIHASIDEVWDFVSSPKNLKEITPEYLGFDITLEDLPEKMYPGMIIAYKVKPLLGIPVTWVTEITQVIDKEYFIDEQRIGPYAFWHHQHRIEERNEGILMTDIITYKPPFGFIGSLANTLFIRQQLKKIFIYRRDVLDKKFHLNK